MNAPAQLPSADTLAEALAASPHHQTKRYDGWTPEKQRGFLEYISEGYAVSAAAYMVGMSSGGAHAFRRRAAGGAFALGWAAANLLARDVISDKLMNRAVDGFTETMTRDDGDRVVTIERHRFDNRLAHGMLTRLDRQAEDASATTHHAARLVAQEFDAFLDLLERDEGPARAGLFLNARAADDQDLEPIRALARADRYLRGGASLAEEVDTADLDPAQRSGWTAGQWSRAECAGIIAVAPESPPPACEDGELNPALAVAKEPVFWSDYEGKWYTRFPPPADFAGAEEGQYGDPDYERELSPEEEAVMAASERDEAAIAERRVVDAAERDRFFGFAEDEDAGGEAQAGGVPDATELDDEGYVRGDRAWLVKLAKDEGIL